MDHLERTRTEFTRQAAQFATSAAITAAQLTARFVDAVEAGPRATVLDVACGPGIVMVGIAAKAKDVVGFDLTPEMLRQAQERCAKAGRSNVTFQQGSATALPFPDGSFDGVVTRLSVHHFDAPKAVLAELARVAKPGAQLVLADVVSSADARESELHNAIEILRDPSHVRMLPVSELRALITDAGFVIETESTWDQTRKFEEWAAIVDDPQRIGPLRVIVDRLARAGEHAGFGLQMTDGAVAFFHRWHLVTGRKPG
ncbi:MAG TPA: methyltransferase domain-containing protein [Acetobacteraceae bacterium]|jgi:ubiquinone/menaquinone biosynthesis C-methylase UbiE|nr:methyltransferase domain-containing protein [Acetobacteraceae bacterium]